MSTSLRLSVEGPVAEIVLQQAPCNEIGMPMLEALEEAIAAVEDSSARALVISSSQVGFCAGADLRELYKAIAGRSPEDYQGDLRSFIDRIHAVMNRLDMLPMPTIAAVFGVCFGGGFELALACDLIIADRSARFCFPELRLGLVPGFGGVPRLLREVPNAVVRDLLLTGRSLSAKRAHELGLVSQVVAEGQSARAALAAGRQAALFDREVSGAAKRFMKPHPEAHLQEEKDLFIRMFADPRVEAALADFVSRLDPMPYQPQRQEKMS